LGKVELTRSVHVPVGLTKSFGYGSGSDSGKVPCSDSGKESRTISGKNPGKKSGKQLSDWVRTWVRRLGKTKMCEARILLYFG
jgi:hypothetical protein